MWGKDSRHTRHKFASMGEGLGHTTDARASSKFACYVGERHTRHKRPELGTHGMRGSKSAGFSGVGERAACSQVWYGPHAPCSHERPRASLRDALHEPSALAASQLRSYALPYCGPQWTGTRQALGAGRFTTMLHAHGRPPHRWASASVARAARHHPTVWTEVIGTTAWRSGL